MQRRNEMDFQTLDQVAHWYDEKYIEMQGAWHTPPEEIEAHLDALQYPADAKNTRLVDLGCGGGHLLERALLRGGICFGLEISRVGRGMTRVRCGYHHNLVVMETPMEQLGWMWPGVFDYAISLGSMEHCLDINAAVRSMADCLKAGGRWLLYVPNELWAHMDQPLECTATAEEWELVLKLCGLEVEKVDRMNDNNRIVGRKP